MDAPRICPGMSRAFRLQDESADAATGAAANRARSSRRRITSQAAERDWIDRRCCTADLAAARRTRRRALDRGAAQEHGARVGGEIGAASLRAGWCGIGGERVAGAAERCHL